MVGLSGAGPSIRFRFSYAGESRRPPDPETHPTLRHYTAGYRLASAVIGGESPDVQWPWTTVEIRAERPNQRLGVLAHRSYQPPAAASESETLFGELTSNVALMRNPRFVVRYMEIPRDPNGLAQAGVFIADPELDAEFAAAEPVAHDHWSARYMQLQKFERNPVRQALERIRNAFRRGTAQGIPDEGAGGFRGLTGVASLLGGLLAGQLGGTHSENSPRSTASRFRAGDLSPRGEGGWG